MKITSLALLILALAGLVKAQQTQLTVTAVNKLNITRQSETIELAAQALAPLAASIAQIASSGPG